MRLWHKDLISVLPRQQLLGQWRECCLIAKQLLEKGYPNHILVNKISAYPISQFNVYCKNVYDEMCWRGYKCNWNKYTQWAVSDYYGWDITEIFTEWHNDRYLKQCYYNLQEKYDCGRITETEWQKIQEVIK